MRRGVDRLRPQRSPSAPVSSPSPSAACSGRLRTRQARKPRWDHVQLDLPGARRFMAADAAVESRSVGVCRGRRRAPCVPGTSTDGRRERADPGSRRGAFPLAGTAHAPLRRSQRRPEHDRELPGCCRARVHGGDSAGCYRPAFRDGDRHPDLRGRLRFGRRRTPERDVRLRVNRSLRARFGLAGARLQRRHHAGRLGVDGSPR